MGRETVCVFYRVGQTISRLIVVIRDETSPPMPLLLLQLLEQEKWNGRSNCPTIIRTREMEWVEKVCVFFRVDQTITPLIVIIRDKTSQMIIELTYKASDNQLAHAIHQASEFINRKNEGKGQKY